MESRNKNTGHLGADAVRNKEQTAQSYLCKSVSVARAYLVPTNNAPYGTGYMVLRRDNVVRM